MFSKLFRELKKPAMQLQQYLGVVLTCYINVQQHFTAFFVVVFFFKLVNLPPVKEAIESLESNGVNYELYDKVRIEPTDTRY